MVQVALVSGGWAWARRSRAACGIAHEADQDTIVPLTVRNRSTIRAASCKRVFHERSKGGRDGPRDITSKGTATEKKR